MSDLFAAAFSAVGSATALAACSQLAPEPGSEQGAGLLPQQWDPLWWGHNPLPGTDAVAPTVFTLYPE